MNVASPESNGLPIRWWEVASRKRTRGNYTLEQLLSPFGLGHMDAILAALEKRGLKKDSATTDQELPAQFRCDKKQKAEDWAIRNPVP